MVGSRAAVAMSQAEVADFLAGQMKVQLATIGPTGVPHLTTLFYVLEDGWIAFWTYGRSQKVRNMRRDPRVSCLVEAGEDYGELRGVSITGRARVLEEYDEVRRLGELVVRRMTRGSDLGEMGEDMVRAQAHKRVGVVIEPTSIASWDHRKMSGPPGPAAPTEEESSEDQG